MRFGWMELIIILVIVLIIFGGNKLTGIGKKLGRNIKDFKKEIKKDETVSEADPDASDAAD